MARLFENGVDFGGNKGVNLASPSVSTDAANKGYVDNALAGLSWKSDVRAATTTNGTLATAYANGSVIDGVTLATGDRILIKNQTTQTDNGIYTVNATGAPTRSTDDATSTEMNNATVSVLQGTVNTLTSWTQVTANPTIGTSNIVWSAFAVGQVYTAASTGGLSLTIGAFSVLLPANSGLSTSGSGLVVSLGSNPGLTLTGGLAVLLATNSGLATTGGLGVVLDPTFLGSSSGLVLGASGLKVDHTKIPAIYAASLGDGTTLVYTITHNLGTLDTIVQTYLNAGGAQVECDIIHATTNTTTVGFATAPATNAVRFVALG